MPILVHMEKTYSELLNNPKSDKEILEYLAPYTKVDGIRYPKLITHYVFNNKLTVEIDIQRAFKNYGGSSKIKSHLRRHGFKNDMGVWSRELICYIERLPKRI